MYFCIALYSAKMFLPARLQNSFGIVSEVEKMYLGFEEKKVEDSINEVVAACQQLSTMKGVFFQVTVPVKTDILSLIPRKRMEQRWFGINHNGVFSIDINTGEVGVPVWLCRTTRFVVCFLSIHKETALVT